MVEIIKNIYTEQDNKTKLPNHRIRQLCSDGTIRGIISDQDLHYDNNGIRSVCDSTIEPTTKSPYTHQRIKDDLKVFFKKNANESNNIKLIHTDNVFMLDTEKIIFNNGKEKQEIAKVKSSEIITKKNIAIYKGIFGKNYNDIYECLGGKLNHKLEILNKPINPQISKNDLYLEYYVKLTINGLKIKINNEIYTNLSNINIENIISKIEFLNKENKTIYEIQPAKLTDSAGKKFNIKIDIKKIDNKIYIIKKIDYIIFSEKLIYPVIADLYLGPTTYRKTNIFEYGNVAAEADMYLGFHGQPYWKNMARLIRFNNVPNIQVSSAQLVHGRSSHVANNSLYGTNYNVRVWTTNFEVENYSTYSDAIGPKPSSYAEGLNNWNNPQGKAPGSISDTTIYTNVNVRAASGIDIPFTNAAPGGAIVFNVTNAWNTGNPQNGFIIQNELYINPSSITYDFDVLLDSVYLVYFESDTKPVINFTSHTNNQVVNTNSISLSGTCTDDSNIIASGLKYSINGVDYFNIDNINPALPSTSVTWSQTINLSEGINTIYIKADDGVTAPAIETINIEYIKIEDWMAIEQVNSGVHNLVSGDYSESFRIKIETFDNKLQTDAVLGDIDSDGNENWYINAQTNYLRLWLESSIGSNPIILYNPFLLILETPQGQKKIYIGNGTFETTDKIYIKSDGSTYSDYTLNTLMQAVDIINPAISNISPVSGSTLTYGQPFTLSGEADDNIKTVEVKKSTESAANYQLATGTTNWNISLIPDTTGTITYDIRVTDYWGQKSYEHPTYTVGQADTTPPALNITTPNNTTVTIDSATIAGTAQDETQLAELKYSKDGITYYDIITLINPALPNNQETSWSQLITGLNAGSNTIYIKAIDNASPTPNETIKTVNIIYNIDDIIPPTINILSHINNEIVNTQNITLSGTSNDNFAVDRVEVSVAGGQFQKTNGTTNWSINIKLTLNDNNIIARAYDTAGNYTDTNINIIYDNITPPELTIDKYENESGSTILSKDLSLSGTVSDDIATVEIKLNQNDFVPANIT